MKDLESFRGDPAKNMEMGENNRLASLEISTEGLQNEDIQIRLPKDVTQMTEEYPFSLPTTENRSVILSSEVRMFSQLLRSE